MRRHWQWVLAIGWVLACYGPTAPEAVYTSPAMQPQEAESSAAGPKVPPDAPPEEVYPRVQAAEEHLLRPWRPQPAEIWRQPGNLEQALSEFRGFQERVQSLENIADRILRTADDSVSRMFAGWQRLRADGVETACETDASEPPRATRPLGGVTRWRYDSDHADPRFRGNLLEKEEQGRPGPSPLGFVKRGWRWSYHPEIALPVKSAAFEVTPDGNERTLLESSFEYDQQDLDLVREQTGERITQVVRNRFGLPVVKWDGRGCATLSRYYSSYNGGQMSARNGGLAAEIVTDASQADIAAALREANVQMKPNGLPARQAEGEASRRRSQFRYDRRGCTIWEQYPGYRIARVWNKLGQSLAVLDSRADLVVYDYDAGLRRTGQWRRIERLKAAPYPGETRPDAQGHFAAESFRYDAFGRLAAWNPTLEKVGAGEPPVRHAPDSARRTVRPRAGTPRPDKRSKPPLPQIPAPLLAEVDPSRVAPMGLADRPPQALLGPRHGDQVDGVGHEAITPNVNAFFAALLGHQLRIGRVIYRRRRTFAAAGCHAA